jgi:hypothetical protein
MNPGTSSGADQALLRRWVNVLQYWEQKRSQYEFEKATTTDPNQQLVLQQEIETCQDVIDTCQGLIQALNRAPKDKLSVVAGPSTFQRFGLGPQTMPASIESKAVHSPTAAWARGPAPTSIEAELDAIAPLQSQTTALTSPQEPFRQRKQQRRKTTGSTALGSVHWGVKPILGGALPVLLIVAAFMVLFRPRDVCKIAPDGSYSQDGLSLQVKKALVADPSSPSVISLSVAQNGCAIVLKGTVPSQQVADELVKRVLAVQVPSQTFSARLQQRFSDGQTQWVQPVEAVKSELKVVPAPLFSP